jgi:hypothetical protein
MALSESNVDNDSLKSLELYSIDNEPPPLILNPSPVIVPQPQQAKRTSIVLPTPAFVGLSAVSPRRIVTNPEQKETNAQPKLPSLLMLEPRRRTNSATNIYTARWKVSAPEILHLLQSSSGIVKDVKHRFSVHKNVIIGSQLVTYFVTSRICSTREDAVDLGQHLIMDDILEHEYQEHVFKDKYLFYRIVPNAAQNAANIGNSSSDESDYDDTGSVAEPQHFPQMSKKSANIGHSILARHLMRNSMPNDSNDKDSYLNDAALQDDIIAQAAADRSQTAFLCVMFRFLFLPFYLIHSIQSNLVLLKKSCADIWKMMTQRHHRFSSRWFLESTTTVWRTIMILMKMLISN